MAFLVEILIEKKSFAHDNLFTILVDILLPRFNEKIPLDSDESRANIF